MVSIDWLDLGEASQVAIVESDQISFTPTADRRHAKLYRAGLHKLWYPSIRDTSTWSKFAAHGVHGDVFLFSNLGAL